jgi:hypothetical protein
MEVSKRQHRQISQSSHVFCRFACCPGDNVRHGKGGLGIHSSPPPPPSQQQQQQPRSCTLEEHWFLCEPTVLGEGGVGIHTNHTKHSHKPHKSHKSHKSHKFESCFWQTKWNFSSKSHYSQDSNKTNHTNHTNYSDYSHNPPTHPPFPELVTQKRESSWINWW